MFENKRSDLHMHLNGSYSMEFLEKIAERNNCIPIFLELKKARDQFLLTSKTNEGFDEQTVTLIWKQFSFVHQLVKTVDDILEGTIDVIAMSKASYMEIRTTPKQFDGQTASDYISAFVDGLIAGNQQFIGKKVARGLLSLDRTSCTEEEAYFIVDSVVKCKAKNGALIGIDICGDPFAQRKLSGEGLIRVLRYALAKSIGVAIHVGEVDTLIEGEEINGILGLLEDVHTQVKTFTGKVRLGHGIFLSKAQCKRIQKLELPIEVCPTCHEKVNWCLDFDHHPVKKIYPLWKAPLVVGTDCSTIFGCDIKKEDVIFRKIFSYPDDESKAELYLHQSKFRFQDLPPTLSN